MVLVAHSTTDYLKHHLSLSPAWKYCDRIDFLKAIWGGILGWTFPAPISWMMIPTRCSTRTYTWISSSWLHIRSCTVFDNMLPFRDKQLLIMLWRRIEGWEVVAHYCRRYEIRATPWKVLAVLLALISLDNDHYVDCAIKEASGATRGALTLPKVLHDLPAVPNPSESGLVSIPV